MPPPHYHFKPSLALAAFIALACNTPVLAQTATITADTPACTSWAGWREWVQASLTAKGARRSKHCPFYIAKGSKVDVIEADDGQGAAQVRWRGKEWYTHSDRLK